MNASLRLFFACALLCACSNNPPVGQTDGGDAGSPPANEDAGSDAGSRPDDQCSLSMQACDAGQSCLLTALEDGGQATRCAGGACDLVLQNCPVGEKCTYVSDAGGFERGCAPEGTADEGSPCTGTPSSNTCRAGLVCALRELPDGGVDTACARFCNTTAQCTSPKLCNVVLTLAGTAERPTLCGDPPPSCDLFAQDCQRLNDACYPSGSVAACFPEGTLGDGEACVYSNDCVKGSACTGGGNGFTCRPLCGTGGAPACASGTCVSLLGFADVGVCR
ncbi:MAG: hypothetical protein ACOZIN_13910 [Myxococcota bacterium]